jgi:hypothetical protein
MFAKAPLPAFDQICAGYLSPNGIEDHRAEELAQAIDRIPLELSRR